MEKKNPKSLLIQVMLRAINWEKSLMSKFKAVPLIRLPILFLIIFLTHFFTFCLIWYLSVVYSFKTNYFILIICSSTILIKFPYWNVILISLSGTSINILWIYFFASFLIIFVYFPCSSDYFFIYFFFSYIFFHSLRSICWLTSFAFFSVVIISVVPPMLILRQ